MKTISIILSASVLGVLGLAGTTHGAGQYATVEYPASTAENELQVGVTYTLWIPDGVKTLRGVIVHQHGAGTTASKEGATAAYDLHWQALAKKWDCALLGPSYHVLNEKIDISPGGFGVVVRSAPRLGKDLSQGPRRSRRQVRAS